MPSATPKSVASSPAPVSSLPKKLTISDAAVNLIVAEEDGSEAYYTKHYTHFEWPQGASGPTIGIGYDCGYVSKLEAEFDWNGIVDEKTLAAILSACGKKGHDAEMFVKWHGRSVTISWDQAIREFRCNEVPKWIKRVNDSLPNCAELSPDSLGALVSLAYNRGCSFNLTGPRFAEMREIKFLMSEKKFDKIPAEIRHMKRLWSPSSGVWHRRDHEAALFERGLAK